ncbi:MAG: tetratricopeptide repeat protein [Flavobacteriaceae bacterium]|nr:tetratricopeptide repeat protein [Flavobacteriaceae bacterium]
MNWKNYWNELQRRNVIRSGIAYLVVAWLLVQVFSIILPAFEFSNSALKTSIIILAIGFPFWIIFSWIYEFTPDGIRKTDDIQPEASISAKTGARLNKIIITTLAVVIVLLLIDRFTRQPAQVMDFGENSIAVLAFADMSPKKDHEYFSDGISEELLNLLVKIPELKVISRTSSFSYKGKNATATEIGNQLNVTHILDGSIRKAGNTVRITAQLIRTSDGSQEWSKTFDRDLDSIFKIQDEIAKEVSKELKLSLLGETSLSQTVNTEAYNLYLQAKHLTLLNSKASYIEAEEKIKQSIAIDSNYAASLRLLAAIYDTGMYNFSIREADEGIPLGMKAAKKAIELDPASGRAYATLASLQELSWEFEASGNSMKKALELDPNNAVIIGTAALNTFGDLEKSVRLLQKAIQLDPLVYGNYFNLGFVFYRLNRLDEAEKAFETFALYYPNWQIYHYMMAKIRLAQGRFDEARAEIDQETHEFFSLYGRNFVAFASGRKKEADSLFAELLEKYGKTDPANIADMYAFRGNYDEAFNWLNKAYDYRDPVLIEALTYPSFKPMRPDSRWAELIERMNFPEDHGFQLE